MLMLQPCAIVVPVLIIVANAVAGLPITPLRAVGNTAAASWACAGVASTRIIMRASPSLCIIVTSPRFRARTIHACAALRLLQSAHDRQQLVLHQRADDSSELGADHLGQSLLHQRRRGERRDGLAETVVHRARRRGV